MTYTTLPILLDNDDKLDAPTKQGRRRVAGCVQLLGYAPLTQFPNLSLDTTALLHFLA